MAEQQLMDAGNPILSLDMIAEILSWLPPKSLCRVRSVSKPWKSLICNPNFVKLHFNKSSENKCAFYRRRRVMFTKPDVYYARLDRFKFTVYSLKTDSWRVVESAPIHYNGAVTAHGVLLNGSVHWVMEKVGKDHHP